LKADVLLGALLCRATTPSTQSSNTPDHRNLTETSTRKSKVRLTAPPKICTHLSAAGLQHRVPCREALPVSSRTGVGLPRKARLSWTKNMMSTAEQARQRSRKRRKRLLEDNKVLHRFRAHLCCAGLQHRVPCREALPVSSRTGVGLPRKARLSRRLESRKSDSPRRQRSAHTCRRSRRQSEMRKPWRSKRDCLKI
jgi:hypothetical protein